MRINSVNNKTFRGPLDGIVTNTLRACDMNEMVNAVGLDVGAMVIPRSYYDTKKRNEYAGAETFIREFSGTFINCLSAGLFAMGISKIASKKIEPQVKINPDCWFSNNSLDTLKLAWDKSSGMHNYIQTVIDNISGYDGKKINQLKNIDWNKVEWIDEEKWKKIDWDNSKYIGIQNRLKTKDGFVNSLYELISDKNITQDDKKNVLSIMEKRLTNVLGAGRYTALEIDGHKHNAKLENILRDTHDMGKNIFTKQSSKEIEQAINKIKRVNKVKAFGAITASCLLGLSNQALNRKITEKRTGKKGFVGDIDYTSAERNINQKDNLLILKKIGASALMAGMVFSTMGVKRLKDFGKKLEFTGPVTSGNAIKTVYGATIVGRFMAADNGTELRESMTRDCLGFLNWLVFGGFAAKGVANLLDKKGDNLFNYTKEGKGLNHWLKYRNLKTHNEIAAKGKDFAKKNMWKLNLAHASGIAYSAITLGVLLPMMNAKITEYKTKKR